MKYIMVTDFENHWDRISKASYPMFMIHGEGKQHENIIENTQTIFIKKNKQTKIVEKAWEGFVNNFSFKTDKIEFKVNITKEILPIPEYSNYNNGWHVYLPPVTEGRGGIIPKKIFVSKSFDESDKDINQYVTDILTSLKIEVITGQPYSKDSIPEKVQSRIRDSDIFIVIFVKREEIKGGGYTTSPWLIKEVGIAQGARKDIIAWVEKDIKDIAGLNFEKEVIYFERNNLKGMEKATIKFLEALKEHGLI